MVVRSHLVVPVDLSEPSRAAARRAFQLAGTGDTEVELIHAYLPPPTPPEPGVDVSLADRLREAQRVDFDRFQLGLREGGHAFRACFIDGDAVVAIERAAAAPGVRMVVMGAHGRRGFDRLLLGSVTERTLHRVTRPLYVVRGPASEADRPIRSILLATDFSRDAEAIERQVAELARPTGAEVEVLHVIRETALLFAPYAVPGTSDFEGEMMDAARRRIERVAERLSLAGVSVKTKVVYGRPAESILERAEATGVQLVALGRRGDAAFPRFLLGSVVQRVLRHAPCDVLVAGHTPSAATGLEGVSD